MKKKFLLTLTFCLAATCSALLFSACGSRNDNSECVHSYESVIVQPTCTEQGFTIYTCSKCNNSYKDEYVNSLGHDLVNHEAKAATCSVKGWSAYEDCTRCDYTTFKEIPSLLEQNVITDHIYINGFCKLCNEQEPTLNCLTFKLKEDGTYRVFGANENIENAVIPSIYNGKLVTTIGNSAFYCYYQLTSIVIPDSITVIADYSFQGCHKLENVQIPSYAIDIGAYAFAACNSIKTLTIPDSVTYLGDSAFSGCESLSSITIGKGVPDIRDCTFATCISLQSIVLPDGLARIARDAFQMNFSLSSITIPHSLTSVGARAFVLCNALNVYYKGTEEDWNKIQIGGDNSELTNAPRHYLSSSNGGDNNDNNHEHSYTESRIAPTCTENGFILQSCACGDVKGETIPALGHDYQNHSAKLPTCTEIGWEEYQTCSRCDYTTYREIEAAGHDYANHSTKAATCTENGFILHSCACGDVKGEVVPALGHDYVNHSAKAPICKEIGWEEYQTCSRCDYSSFKAIPALNEHNYVDGYCSMCQEPEPTANALSFTLKRDNTYEVKAMYKTIEEVNIPSLFNGKRVTSIGDSAFNNCTLLTNVTLPFGITSIGDSAFNGCTSLTDINIPGSVTSIGDSAFQSTSLTDINIPNGVSFIGGDAFSFCGSLMSITIPDGITQISRGLIRYCPLLTSITIPDSVTSIGSYAFNECKSLTSITIPDGVTSIGDETFRGCTSLTSITIPDGVTSIGRWAFSGNSVTIYCEAIAEPIGWDNVWLYSNGPVVWDCENNEVANDGSVYVIVNGLRYALKDGIATVAGQPSNINGEINIDSTIKYKNINYAVTSIGRWAFGGCNSLTSITIPDSVTSIGDYAFYDCSSLTSIIIPKNSVTSIGTEAFYDCSSLTSIIIPNSVTSIGEQAFFYCSNLTIYAEAESEPANWESGWNYSYRPVVWGYKGEEANL